MKSRGTVAMQHEWYLWKSTQLVTQLRAWRAAGEEVILFIVVNKNMYTGPLAKALRGEGLLIEEQNLCSTKKEVPHSHCTGKVVMVGMHATPGIFCTNSYLSPHGAGMGDCWFQLHDFDAQTVHGTDYPKMVHPNGRAHCGVEQTVKQYNKLLRQLLIRHQSYEKLEFLQAATSQQMTFN
jgi:hypothetical protein